MSGNTLDSQGKPTSSRILALCRALRRADRILARSGVVPDPQKLRELRARASFSLFATYLSMLIVGRSRPLESALAYHALARSIHDKERDATRSLPLFEVAYRCYLAAPDGAFNDCGRLLFTYSNALYQIDAVDEALTMGRQALHILAVASPYEHASAWANLADIYDRAQHSDDAIYAGEQALGILSRQPPDDESCASRRAEVLRDLGFAYMEHRGDFLRARDLLAAAGEWLEAYGNPMQLGSLLQIQGRWALELGRYHQAAQFFSRAADLRREAGNNTDLALLHLDRARLAFALNDIEEAVAMLQLARAGFVAVESIQEQADASMLSARIGAARGRFADATAELEQARVLARRMNNPYVAALSDLESARLQLLVYQLSRNREALIIAMELLGRAEQQFSVLARPRQLLEARILRALHSDPPDLNALLTFDAEAARFEDHLARAQIQSRVGELLEQIDQGREALGSYGRACALLLQARRQLRVAGQIARFLRDRRRPYERAFALATTQGDLDAAWDYLEQPRAPALADLLQNSVASDELAALPAAPEPLQNGIEDLRDRLDALYALDGVSIRQTRQGDTRASAIPAQRGELEQQLSRLLEEAEQRGDLRATWESGRVCAVADVRRALGPETVLVQYTLVSRSTPGPSGRYARDLWALVLTPTTLRVVGAEHPLATAAQLKLLEQRLFDPSFGTIFGRGGADTATYRPDVERKVLPALSEMYRLCIAPLAELLEPHNHIVFALPDDAPWMQLLPLHAAHNGSAYLVERFSSISYTPSASVLWRCAQQPVGSGAMVCGYAPDIRDLHKELAAAAAYSGVPWRLGPFAAEGILAELRDVRLAHLSCHGDAQSSSDARFAHLVVGPQRRLYAHDLFRARLRADLVVLSACESGRQAQPHLGLAGGVLAAGARSVVATLWRTSHAASTALMHHFYAALAASPGQGRAWALCQAQRALIADPTLSHVAQWAPFFLSGFPGPLEP